MNLSNCAGSSESKQETEDLPPVDKPRPPSPQTKLSPGTIKVAAVLVDYSTDEDIANCVLRVEEVLGYGMATKPMGVGTEVQVDIKGNIANELSKESREQKYIIILQQQENLNFSSTQSQWRALKIQKKESVE